MENLIAKKTGYGHYRIYILKDYEELGYFDTTDAEIFDDVNEMNNDGFEKDLVKFESFDEIIQFCFNKLN